MLSDVGRQHNFPILIYRNIDFLIKSLEDKVTCTYAYADDIAILIKDYEHLDINQINILKDRGA